MQLIKAIEALNPTLEPAKQPGGASQRPQERPLAESPRPFGGHLALDLRLGGRDALLALLLGLAADAAGRAGPLAREPLAAGHAGALRLHLRHHGRLALQAGGRGHAGHPD